jgi:hypothetical protein
VCVRAVSCVWVWDAGSDVNAAADGQHKRTPAHLAAAGGHSEVLELLVAARADLNAKDDVRVENMIVMSVTSMYICMYICMYVYIYIVYVCIYVCIYVCMYVCLCVCVCVYTYVCTYVYHTYIHICICILCDCEEDMADILFIGIKYGYG